MPQLDLTWLASQAFWVIVTFSAMFLIMWRFVIPLMRATVDVRKARVEGDIRATEQLKTEAGRFLKDYESAMASVSVRTQEILAKAQDESSAFVKQAEDDFTAKLTIRVHAEEASIQAAKAKALDDVHSISVELADKILHKIADITLPLDDISAVAATMSGKKS